MAADPKHIPLTPEIISAAQWAAGRRFTPTGTGSAPGQPDPSKDFFGPGWPLPPLAPPEAAGRQFDYPVGYNLLVTPRGDLPISFLDLRNLAQNCDLVRLVIETRKDQIAKMNWSFSPLDPSGAKLKAKKDASAESLRQAKEATALMKRPDRMHSFNAWMRMLLEDMLVIDAATIYPRRTKGGGLYSLEVVDGATIRPVIDEWGRSPLPPDPAYQQIIKGLPATDYTREELLYYPRNLLSWRLYGFSPVEQVIIITNIILRRQMHLLQFYTEGNLPDALLEVPENWSTAQIAEFQQYWDALHAGNTAQRRRGKWVPHGMTPHLMKEGDLSSPIDEWFARVVCYAFSVSAQPFVSKMNRATATTAQEAALSEGLAPLMEWMADFINYALQGNGFDQVEFGWEEDTAIDPAVQAQVDDLDVRNGIRLRSEIRESRGLEDDGTPDFIMTTQGPVLVSEIGKEPEPAPEPDGQKKSDGGKGGGEGPDTPGAAEGSSSPGSSAETPPQKLAKQSVGRESAAHPAFNKAVKKKRKTVIKPIDRERPEIVEIRDALKKLMAKALKADAQSAAAQLGKGLGLKKAVGAAVGAASSRPGRVEPAPTGPGAGRSRPYAKAADDEAKINKLLAEMELTGIEATREQVAALLAKAAQQGGYAAFVQIDYEAPAGITDLVNTQAVTWAQEHAADLITKLEDDTRDMIRSAVVQAQEEGWSTKKLADALQENHGFSDARAEMIARTETIRADCQGNLAAYKNSALVSGKSWLLGSEHPADDECDDNAAEGVIPLDQDFSSGDEAPPAHPNCTCDFLPEGIEGVD